jgi:hypothetical protein
MESIGIVGSWLSRQYLIIFSFYKDTNFICKLKGFIDFIFADLMGLEPITRRPVIGYPTLGAAVPPTPEIILRFRTRALIIS